MNAGKVVAVVLAILLVGVFVYMMSDSGEVAQIKQETNAQKRPLASNFSNAPQQTNDNAELAKLNELKNAAQTPNDGVSKLYLTSCAPCHGKDAKGIIAPPIAAKPASEILNILADYKAGKMPNSLMAGLLTNISQSDLEMLAVEIASFVKSDVNLNKE